jgi:hypothetical protein
MSDLQRGLPDDECISVSDCDELRHWSRLLQITPDELKAVCAVGTSAVTVRAHLKPRNQQNFRRIRMAGAPPRENVT